MTDRRYFTVIGKYDGGQVVPLDEPEYVNFYLPGDVVKRNGELWRAVQHPHYGIDFLPVDTGAALADYDATVDAVRPEAQ